MGKTNNTQNAYNIEAAVSTVMQAETALWWDMFRDKAPWIDEKTESLNLASSIAGETARLVMMGMESKITGSARANFLQQEYDFVLERLRPMVEYAAAAGGLIWKPYVEDGRVVVDLIHAGRFVPTAYNSRGEITGAVFADRLQKKEKFFTRLEAHSLTKTGYTVTNTAFVSRTGNGPGTRTSLGDVAEWADLEPELTIRRKDGATLERPLFAYFKMPFANQVDETSPLGVSVYSRAVRLIRQADRQYSRILLEYEGAGLADGAVHRDAERDGPRFCGLNQLLRRIECSCCLPWGTLSDLRAAEKTTEEMKTGRERSDCAVREIRKALQAALEQLVWAMDQYTSLYKLAPDGDYEISFAWAARTMAADGRESGF